MVNINFAKMKIIIEICREKSGITYLGRYNNKNYVIKIQHILQKDKNQSFKHEVWREVDLYNYINTLKLEEQQFFTKLYKVKIKDKCDSKQIGTNNKNNNKLDKSTWCVIFVLEYKGNETLREYLYTKTLTVKQTYSIILQICNILLILYNGGYSHNELHSANIMIKKTKSKSFNMLNKKIPFNGLHVSAIDYGTVLHKKFKINYKNYNKLFLENKKQFLYNELYEIIMPNIILNLNKYFYDCKKKNRTKELDNDNLMKILINKHHDFFTITKHKYIKIFPKGEYLVNYFEQNINNLHDAEIEKDIRNVFNNNKNLSYFWKIIDRIADEFQVIYPKLYVKYYNWCSYNTPNLPKQDILDIMVMNNAQDVINYCIEKINK